MRIAYDLDGTILGMKDGYKFFLRPGIVRKLVVLRKKGHTLILWTFGTREWWNMAKKLFPELQKLFDEVYTRDEIPPKVTRNGGIQEFIKDVRIVKADLLVDNDPAHLRWARRHGLARRYVLAPTVGDMIPR